MTTRNEILAAALLLPERERLEIAGQLLETIADNPLDETSEEAYLDELDRRAGDLEGAVSADDLWRHAAPGE